MGLGRPHLPQPPPQRLPIRVRTTTEGGTARSPRRLPARAVSASRSTRGGCAAPVLLRAAGLLRVRLDAIDEDELRELVFDAWRMVVPKMLSVLSDDELQERAVS